ncbi:Alginate biosynthesis sensor protein KinB [Paraurantiacibacter namhicola]|uniref:histidine kinase n=2 Tax=Paraurantiacibacter namhicola TaxID=645517 RepID=A0A1C7D942_9SPHN|nr:ATP-binding protein [Paraurantiacibacter namhicola]ANU07957.1 Alginate biosynthesis sensor protein KinB [Paraurantiacibacter namhicola]
MPVTSGRSTPRWQRRLALGARKFNLFLWLEILCAVTLVVMVGATYIALSASGANALVPSTQAAFLLVGTLIPALGLIILFGRRMAIRRSGGSRGRLHVRLVFFFSLVAAVPTLLVAVFASFLFQSGVEFWFSDNSRGLFENANELARGYYDQNQREVADETLVMAGDLRFILQQEEVTSPDFAENYSLQVLYRKLNASAILQRMPDGSLRVAAIVDPDEAVTGQRVSSDTIDRLRAGEDVVVLAEENRIEAITAIDRDAGIYLYNARSADAPILSEWRRAQGVTEAYQALTRNARILQLRFNLALFFVSLALVGLAVWFALRFADRQVRPLTELAAAARRVGRGHYSLRVAGRKGTDEVGLLNRAFDRMTGQIERQTADLLGANKQLGERRQFIEAVLESITAGIVSLGMDGRVLLINSSAKALLASDKGRSPIGRKFAKIAPEIAAMIEDGKKEGIVHFNREGELLTLAVKVSGASDGSVITFEDITRQLVDQRQAAWSDVARRIAHEIKNPLTPIQLATERLNRRYRKQIAKDGELFDELTGTIIRQVGDLRTMVDEFSSFARLPKPVFRQEDPVDLVRQALFLQEVGQPNIGFNLDVDGEIGPIQADRHQVGQAMTNVLKNASEALDARMKDAEPDFRPRIDVSVRGDAQTVTVAVRDNGIGLPGQQAERLLEPYVTTREKGTGLGLAIVKKIVEEHGGEMAFRPLDEGGAEVRLTFARNPVEHALEGEASR